MKKKVTVDFLARELNISKTTISRAINNCPGVKSNTKNVILQAALNHGYAPSRISQNVGVVLPSAPVFFWGALQKGISFYAKKSNIKCKQYIYSNIYDASDALQCINCAISDGVSVLILASPDSAEIKTRLEEISTNILVILVEEFLDAKNTFYVGEDSFSQGYGLGERYILSNPGSEFFAITHSTNFHTEKMRIAGFVSALNNFNKKIVAEINMATNSKTAASGYARELSKLNTLPHCIFCPSGNILHMMLALKKLNIGKDIHCIGFDMNTQKSTATNNSIITHVLLQDIDLQAKKIMECTETFLYSQTFPSTKNIYVENICYNGNME